MSYNNEELLEFYNLCKEKIKDISSNQIVMIKTMENKIYTFQNNPFNDNDSNDEFLAFLQQRHRDVKLVKANASEQTIIVETINHQILSFKSPICKEIENEESFIEFLKENDACCIKMVICMWKEGASLDVPSYRFRKKLMELNLENENSLLILQGMDGFVIKKLKATL